jgi:hypothetical protein
MKKLILLTAVGLGMLVAAGARAKDAGVDVNKSAKQASNAVGGMMGQIGKVISPGVGKVESSLDGAKNKDGKKSDKAGK